MSVAKIKMIYSGVSEANFRLQKTLRDAKELSDSVADLQARIPTDVQARYQIGEQLQMCRRSAETTYLQGRKLLNVTQAGLAAYRSTDAALRREALNTLGKDFER